MDNMVWIVLIIAIAVVIVLFIFRKQLREFNFKANPKGVETVLKTQPGAHNSDASSYTSGKRPRTLIGWNKQIGKHNRIEVSPGDIAITDNLQGGDGNVISIQGVDEKKTKKK